MDRQTSGSRHAGESRQSRADPVPPPLRSVALVIDHGMSAFEFAIPCEVFGLDRSPQGLPAFEFSICSPQPGPVLATTGFQVIAPHRLGPLASADLVIVPGFQVGYTPPPELLAALRAVVARGARVASLCSGAFVLAEAGLLDGRRATTHWLYSETLQARFPTVELLPNVLFVEDGPVATSAGTAAGIDLCLHLVRRSWGPEVANGIARRMVVPAQREGGQAQYVVGPTTTVRAPTLAPLLDWAAEHLDQDLSVALLAGRAAMSPRTFARRFRAETGTSPHQWVLVQRVALAERLLETADVPIEEVARRCGFSSAAMLRHHFTRLRGTAPTSYRRTFGPQRAGGA